MVALAVPGTAAAIDIPTGDPNAVAPASAPADSASSTTAAAPPAPAVPAAPAPATAPATPMVLRLGSRGQVVRDLQRELRRRGYRAVTVDGAFGPGTATAVRKLQKRLKMKVTGEADARLLKRIGLQVNVVASAPPTATVAAPVAAQGARYLRAFPVLGTYSYINDFGAARHQGSHEGTDIIAPAGSPVVAVADGTIERMTRTERGLGGIYIWLEDRAGNDYYYAHLLNITDGLSEGSRVAVGQVIGAVGQTGDARGTVDHLHFEIRPGGNGSINPYPELRAVDSRAARSSR